MIAGQLPKLTWSGHAEATALRVLGWSESDRAGIDVLFARALGEAFAVVPASAVRAALSLPRFDPMPGRFEWDGEALCFTPRFAFSAGLEYALLRTPSGGVPTLIGTVRAHASAPSTGRSHVTAIFPTAEVVPFNLLRIYVHFSEPMREGAAREGVTVVRADTGAALTDVFLPAIELWDREHRRLTLLLDPGRIKRGLLPHQQLGYPLIEGVPITLRINTHFRGADGHPLAEAAARRFEVGPAIRERVDPRTWQCDAPAAGTRGPLAVRLERSLDHALLAHALTVREASGAPVRGSVSLGVGEDTWSFEPIAPWATGAHTIEVDTRLEDIAGNSVTRVFDRDLHDPHHEDEPATTLSFVCS